MYNNLGDDYYEKKYNINGFVAIGLFNYCKC